MFFHAILIYGKVGQVSRTSSQETPPKTRRCACDNSLSEAHANDEDEDMLTGDDQREERLGGFQEADVMRSQRSGESVKTS